MPAKMDRVNIQLKCILGERKNKGCEKGLKVVDFFSPKIHKDRRNLKVNAGYVLA